MASIKERYEKLVSTISPEDSVAIIIMPDPDALASAMALKRLLWRKAKRCHIFRTEPIQRPDNLAMVRLLKIPLKPLRELRPTDFTKYAIVDNQPHHNPLFEGRHYHIIIDHHPKAGPLDSEFVDIRQDMGATSTILWEYFRAAGIKPSTTMATALFYGIKTDTFGLIRAGTPRDLDAYRDLYRHVSKEILLKLESSEFTRGTLLSFHKALEKVKFINNKAFVFMGEVKNTNDLVMIADFFVKVADVDWAIVAGVKDEKLVVIFRYFGTRSDAGKKAMALFGPLGGSAGGHRATARAELDLSCLKGQLKALDNLERYLIKLVRRGRPKHH